MELEYMVQPLGADIEKEQTALSILEKGLTLPERAQSVLSTAVSLGENIEATRLAHEVSDYKYGQGQKANIVLAVPEVIQNSSGERIFLGFPERNSRTSAQQYDAHCILDRICSQLHQIPPEFILGYYFESPNGGKSFVPNDSHISHLTPDRIDELFSTLSAGMNDITKLFNESVIQRKVTSIEKSKESWSSRGLQTHLLDNLLRLINKYNPAHRKHIMVDNKTKTQNGIDRQ